MTRVRVAVHVHSEWSYDGSWTLEALAAEFGRRGYGAVLMAEHDRGFDERRWAAYRAACAAASIATLLVPGIEYSDAENAVHVPVWGDLPFLGEGLETASMLHRADSLGGLAVLAHPGRRDALLKLDPACLRHLTGIELWNRKYDGYAPNREVANILRQHPEIVPIVALDFHSRRQFHPLALVMEIDGALTATGILTAIRGHYVTPTAFQVPALTLTRGAAWPAINSVEQVRRRAAVHVRRARRLARR